MHISSVWPWLEPGDGFSHATSNHEKLPRISIVTPNCNYGHLIEMTIRSVILQRYPNLEYIVIDDGSTDNSVEVINKYASQLAYFEQHPNQGQYATINKGFSKATGEIFAWLNSDDIYLPWTLRTVAAIFSQFPDVDWIIGRSSGIQDGVVQSVSGLQPFPRPLIRAGLFHTGPGGCGRYIQQESTFWRRSLWERTGGLRTDLLYAADFELWTRFAEYADLHAVSTLLGGFTVRKNENRSIVNRHLYMNEVELVTRHLRENIGSPEARLARRVRLNQKVSCYRFCYKIANTLIPLTDLRGPILTWNFNESCYKRVHRSPF